jgi:hypothetical protein
MSLESRILNFQYYVEKRINDISKISEENLVEE